MNPIAIASLPDIRFAHIYRSEKYRNSFLRMEHFIEITYIAEGRIDVTVSGESFCAQKGDVLCLLHREQTEVSAPGAHCHHTVGITVEWKEATDDHNCLYLPPLLRASDGSESVCRMIDALIHKQALCQSSLPAGAAMALALFCEIDKCCRASTCFRLPGDVLYTQRAKKYVLEHLNEPITQHAIAEHLGISAGYLCTVFKKTEGTTLIKYMNKTKLERLKQLMDSESIRLCDAVGLFGYNDPNYVSRLFKQLFGYNITDKPRLYPELPD